MRHFNEDDLEFNNYSLDCSDVKQVKSKKTLQFDMDIDSSCGLRHQIANLRESPSKFSKSMKAKTCHKVSDFRINGFDTMPLGIRNDEFDNLRTSSMHGFRDSDCGKFHRTSSIFEKLEDIYNYSRMTSNLD